MDPFLQKQMDNISRQGEEVSRSNAEREVRMSQGQTPTIDANIYNPKNLKDAGYPLSNPTEQPNKHTKEGAMVYANRDASNNQPINPITPMPEVQGLSTSMYRYRSDRAFTILDNATNTFELDAATNHIFKGLIQYEKAAQEEFGNLEEANQMKWATSDRLEESGFKHIQESKRGPEGIDEHGLMGLQAIYAAHILRGVTNLSSVTNQVGDTGATEEQNVAAWNSAAMQYQNARYGTALEIPSSKEEQLKDKKYLGASAILMTAIAEAWGGKVTPEQIKSASPEDLYTWGMTNIDAVKYNTVALGMVIKAGKDSNLPVGESINYLFSVEDQLPNTWGDFGRGAAGVLTDPFTYVGGASLIARGMAKVAGKSLVKQALRRAGLMGAEGAAFAGGHEAILDWGQQELDIMALEQEGYDPARGAEATGTGALFGFLFGGALGISTDVAKAGIRWIQKMRKMDAATEFANVPIPDNIISEQEIALRRSAKKVADEAEALAASFTKLNVDARIDAPVNIVEMILEFDVPGKSPKQVMSDMIEIAQAIVDDPSLDGTVFEFIRAKEILKILKGEEASIIEGHIVNRRRGKFEVLEGGATKADPEHMAPMEVIEGEKQYAPGDKAVGIPSHIEVLEARVEKRVKDGVFKFKIGDEVTDKSGKKWTVQHYMNDWEGPGSSPTNDIEYMLKEVRTDDIFQERLAVFESELVGGKPKLSLVPGKSINEEIKDLKQLDIKTLVNTLNDMEQDHYDKLIKADPELAQLLEFGDINNILPSAKKEFGEFGELEEFGEKPDLTLIPKEQSMYRDELRSAAKKLDDTDEILNLYQRNRGQGRDLKSGPPYFDYSTGVTRKERMTPPEREYWDVIFNSKQDLLELLDEVPSVYYKDGIMTIRKEDMFALDEYIDTVIIRKDVGEKLPRSFTDGSFVSKRFIKEKD